MIALARADALWDYAAPGAAGDLELTPGMPPERLGAPGEDGLFWSTDGARFVLSTPAGPRFLCEAGGRRVVYDAAGGQPRDVAAFAFGALTGALAYQRGLAPLHASALQIGDALVAFCARSGAGKSTLAAALAARGARLFADDVLWVDWRARPPRARSISRKLKLDALGARLAGIEIGEPVRSVQDGPVDRRAYAAPGMVSVSDADALALRRLYVLAERDRRPGAPHVEVKRLKGVEALAAVRDGLFRRRWGEKLLGGAILNQAAAAVAASVKVYRFARTADGRRFEETLKALHAHMADLDP